MARPKKKNSNPQQSMEELLATTVALYGIPYDDRDGVRDSEVPSLHTVAEQLGTNSPVIGYRILAIASSVKKHVELRSLFQRKSISNHNK